MSEQVVALDLFAGSGWGVACSRMGITEHGVEIMPEARATRDAVGFSTIFEDVWDGLIDEDLLTPWSGKRRLLIASPPCQSFSMAGKGAGRKALDDVLRLIDERAYEMPVDGLRVYAEAQGLDDRTALVLSPLAYIFRHRPEFVALEQVPTVLPVWRKYCEVLEELGYSAQAEVLNAEMFGVPQTRKRAILVASLLHEAKLPEPTHSRYYPRDPGRLDDGVLPWVSMAEALGWGMTKRPYMTIATGTEAGGTDPAALGGSGARRTVYAERDRGAWEPSGDPDNDGGILRLSEQEAAAIQTFPTDLESRASAIIEAHANGEKIALDRVLALIPEGGCWRDLPDDVAKIVMGGAYNSPGGRTSFYRRLHRDLPAPTVIGSPDHRSTMLGHPTEHRVINEDEAAVLQTFPLRPEIDEWKWRDAPATTVAGDPRITAREHHHHGEQSKTSLKLTEEEAIALQTFPRVVEPADDLPSWPYERPAPTIVGTRRSEQGILVGRQLADDSRRDQGGRPGGVGLKPGQLPGVRVEQDGAQALQTFSRSFPFQGSKSKRFLQIGNAVPPLLAEAVLCGLLHDPELRIAQSVPQPKRLAEEIQEALDEIEHEEVHT